MTQRRGLTWSLMMFLVLLATVLVASYAEESRASELSSTGDEAMLSESHAADKRYLAALAKNGRLPKFPVSQKKDDPSNEQSIDSNIEKELTAEVPRDLWMEDKRHLGAFLKSHGKPHFVRLGDTLARYDRSPAFGNEHSFYTDDSNDARENDIEDSDVSVFGKAPKRNVATLAKLGRLNAVRYGRFQPQYVGGTKRVNSYNDQLNDGASEKDETIEDPNDSTSCDEDDDSSNEETDPDNDTSNNWIQKKRYVAALARSGRLPIWHPQRMWWGGKRDTPSPYWLRYRSGARAYGDKRQNILGNMRFVKLKNKRCKKSAETGGSFPDVPEEKRNLAMLARKGLLPYRPYVPA